MARFEVTWTGEIEKSVVAEVPADGAYWLWSHYREEMLEGTIDVLMEEHAGVTMALIRFSARIARQIEAENASEAVRAMTYDPRLPSSFGEAELTVEEIKVAPVAAPENTTP